MIIELGLIEIGFPGRQPSEEERRRLASESVNGQLEKGRLKCLQCGGKITPRQRHSVQIFAWPVGKGERGLVGAVHLDCQEEWVEHRAQIVRKVMEEIRSMPGLEDAVLIQPEEYPY